MNAACHCGCAVRIVVYSLFPISVTTVRLIKAFLRRFPPAESLFCWCGRSRPAGSLNNSRSETFQVFVGGCRVPRGYSTNRCPAATTPDGVAATLTPSYQHHKSQYKINLAYKNVFSDAQRRCYVSRNEVFLLPKSSDVVFSPIFPLCIQILLACDIIFFSSPTRNS